MLTTRIFVKNFLRPLELERRRLRSSEPYNFCQRFDWRREQGDCYIFLII
jgi:hypothetical protein